MSCTGGVGLARKQRVFAKVEATIGTMVYPSGTLDAIRPVGNAVINQNPAFVDTEELQDTLDVLDQFQSATPAGSWSLSMYLRPSGLVAVANTALPQGSVLFQSLQGLKNAATTMTASAIASATISTVHIGAIAGGDVPEKGVVIIGTEKIHYTGITRASLDATVATLTGCVRGYGSTTATSHSAGTLSICSIFYKQNTCSPTFSLWVETDHFVQGLSGCTIDNAVFDITNEGAVKVTMDGKGMKMVWAGTSAAAAAATKTALNITVDDAKLYKAGAYIKVGTVATISKISAVNTTTNVLTLVAGIGHATATDDAIVGYLPPVTEIGDPIESKDTTVQINGVAAKLKAGSVSFATPHQYIEDEIGTDYPEDFLEDKRQITSTLNLYFKKADAKYFTDGFDGEEVPVLITFGDTAGSIVDIYMKRCKLTVPSVNFASPAVELSIPIKALGTVGEDSAEIIFR